MTGCGGCLTTILIPASGFDHVNRRLGQRMLSGLFVNQYGSILGSLIAGGLRFTQCHRPRWMSQPISGKRVSKRSKDHSMGLRATNRCWQRAGFGIETFRCHPRIRAWTGVRPKSTPWVRVSGAQCLGSSQPSVWQGERKGSLHRPLHSSSDGRLVHLLTLVLLADAPRHPPPFWRNMHLSTRVRNSK